MSWSPRKNISASANPARVTAIMRARAGGREYHGRAPSAAPVLSPAEEDESAGFSDGPVTTVSAEDPASDCEDATDSAGCADSPPVPAASSEVPASSVAPVLSD